MYVHEVDKQTYPKKDVLSDLKLHTRFFFDDTENANFAKHIASMSIDELFDMFYIPSSFRENDNRERVMFYQLNREKINSLKAIVGFARNNPSWKDLLLRYIHVVEQHRAIQETIDEKKANAIRDISTRYDFVKQSDLQRDEEYFDNCEIFVNSYNSDDVQSLITLMDFAPRGTTMGEFVEEQVTQEVRVFEHGMFTIFATGSHLGELSLEPNDWYSTSYEFDEDTEVAQFLNTVKADVVKRDNRAKAFREFQSIMAGENAPQDEVEKQEAVEEQLQDMKKATGLTANDIDVLATQGMLEIVFAVLEEE